MFILKKIFHFLHLYIHINVEVFVRFRNNSASNLIWISGCVTNCIFEPFDNTYARKRVFKRGIQTISEAEVGLYIFSFSAFNT